MKSFYRLIILIFLLDGISGFASTIRNKSIVLEFKRATEYKVILDRSNINYDGLDSVSFVEYNAAKEDSTPEKYATILKYMGKVLSKEISAQVEKECSESSTSPYVIFISLRELTAKAGIKASVKLIFNGNEYEKEFKVKVEDGRWNKFDVLLSENIEKLAKKIRNIINDTIDEIYDYE